MPIWSNLTNIQFQDVPLPTIASITQNITALGVKGVRIVSAVKSRSTGVLRSYIIAQAEKLNQKKQTQIERKLMSMTETGEKNLDFIVKELIKDESKDLEASLRLEARLRLIDQQAKMAGYTEEYSKGYLANYYKKTRFVLSSPTLDTHFVSLFEKIKDTQEQCFEKFSTDNGALFQALWKERSVVSFESVLHDLFVYSPNLVALKKAILDCAENRLVVEGLGEVMAIEMLRKNQQDRIIIRPGERVLMECEDSIVREMILFYNGCEPVSLDSFYEYYSKLRDVFWWKKQ